MSRLNTLQLIRSTADRFGRWARGDLEVERGGQVLGVLIAIPKRTETETALNQLQDRGRIVDRVVDETLLGEGRDDDRRNAHAWPPAIDLGRGHVVPIAAVFVEGYDDDRFRLHRTLLDQVQHLVKMLITLKHVGIFWMLVELANRLVQLAATFRVPNPR